MGKYNLRDILSKIDYKYVLIQKIEMWKHCFDDGEKNLWEEKCNSEITRSYPKTFIGALP